MHGQIPKVHGGLHRLFDALVLHCASCTYNAPAYLIALHIDLHFPGSGHIYISESSCVRPGVVSREFLGKGAAVADAVFVVSVPQPLAGCTRYPPPGFLVNLCAPPRSVPQPHVRLLPAPTRVRGGGGFITRPA